MTSRIDWAQAWAICQKTFAYTNHTLLPEALETWSTALFERVLPRHLQIIYEINHRFLTGEVEARWPGDMEKKRVLSLIEERGGGKHVRMAHLSVLGGHATNGVAALHTRLLCERLFPEFFELYPDRFLNLTNGVTFRRWLDVCNPQLSALITESIGSGWLKDSSKLRELDRFADDTSFRERFQRDQARAQGPPRQNHPGHLRRQRQPRRALRRADQAPARVQAPAPQPAPHRQPLPPHPRKPELDIAPRVFIFGAKAAPGYYLAKNIIHAINALANKVNHDPRVGGKLKVVFMPNYGVSIAERIIPAADLSEQISTAGKEASGTGNMKLALNGALTIGTLDGANVEILEEVGDDNIFIFGLTVEGVTDLYAPRLQSLGLLLGQRGSAPQPRLARLRLLHRQRRTSSNPSATASSPTAIPSSSWPTTTPTPPARPRWTKPTVTSPAGRRWPSSTPPASASSAATAPSSNTPRKSGSCRRWACEMSWPPVRHLRPPIQKSSTGDNEPVLRSSSAKDEGNEAERGRPRPCPIRGSKPPFSPLSSVPNQKPSQEITKATKVGARTPSILRSSTAKDEAHRLRWFFRTTANLPDRGRRSRIPKPMQADVRGAGARLQTAARHSCTALAARA
jgi:hypothetical protein